MKKSRYDLGSLDWHVAGFMPHAWRLGATMEIGATQLAEIPAIPAPVPGSVQQALLNAGELPDWNLDLNARDCEWVENRHWVYEVRLPDTWVAGRDGATVRLRCLGLDGNGVIRLNGWEIATFNNSFIPHVVDLTPHLSVTDTGAEKSDTGSRNVLQIIFECPPRWLGQFGYTSRMTEWKPRYNYHWDWTARLVQIGIWDGIFLEIVEDSELIELSVTTDATYEPAPTGELHVSGRISAANNASLTLHCALHAYGDETDASAPIREQRVVLEPGTSVFDLIWQELEVELWWPNGYGDQPRYTMTVTLLDRDGNEVDRLQRTVGFKHVAWRPCAGASELADPWLCIVNGQEVFLQGFNWTPIRPNFADVEDAAYRQRLELYRDLHVTVLRVWGGAFLEKEVFYGLCDELGLLVWQEFPLSSSGIDNYPPDDAESIAAQSGIARSYIERRQHHVALFIWCGGNELQNDRDGVRGTNPGPLDATHPLLGALHDIVAEMDPTRRYLPTSPSGPTFGAMASNFGKGIHWDVHGPWKPETDLADWQLYWAGDDALARTEVGSPGPSSAELIRRYARTLQPYPGTYANPLWRRTSWWIEWPQFVAEMGREPESLEDYVAWGQARQAEALRIGAEACKGRFPACGAFIVWMGHDSYPCTANTSVIDFEGNPKPAAFALAKVFGSRSH
jgi:beta-mannosidase